MIFLTLVCSISLNGLQYFSRWFAVFLSMVCSISLNGLQYFSRWWWLPKYDIHSLHCGMQTPLVSRKEAVCKVGTCQSRGRMVARPFASFSPFTVIIAATTIISIITILHIHRFSVCLIFLCPSSAGALIISKSF